MTKRKDRTDRLVIDAVGRARREAVAVVQLCCLASRPGLAAGMILAGTGVDAARRTLERLLSDQPAKRPGGGNGGAMFDPVWITQQLQKQPTSQ